MSDPARWIERAAARGASDLYLEPGAPPTGRVGGRLEELAPERLTAAEVRAAVEALKLAARCLELSRSGVARWLVERDSGLRVRVLALPARPALSVRLHPASPRGPEQLGVPSELLAAVTGAPGMVLLAGPPGSGRSTTLAAALRAWDRAVGGRLLLVGAPCDGTLRPERAVVTEACLWGEAEDTARIASGFRSVEEALARAGQAGVDAVAVPGLPSLGALERALALASSGITVLAVVGGRAAPDALRRLSATAPPARRVGLRRRLALALAAVVAQQLVPRRDDGERVAFFDLLRPGPEARWLIAEGAWEVLQSHIEGGGGEGLTSLDGALAKAVVDGAVEAGEALERAGDRASFARRPGVAQALDIMHA